MTGAMQEQEQRSEKAKDGDGFYEDHKSSNVTCLGYSKDEEQTALFWSIMYMVKSNKGDMSRHLSSKKRFG